MARFLFSSARVFGAFVLVATGAYGCAKIADRVDALTGNVDAVDGDVRKVCPTTRLPDGGWQVVEGIDTSDYDVANWDEVAQKAPQYKYGVTRVSAGLVRIDTRFSADWNGIKRAGLIRGAYQYFRPAQSAVAQADLYVQSLASEGGLSPNDLPPLFDVETNNDMPVATVMCRLKIWLTRVENATKRIPIIYTSANHDDVLVGDLSRYPLWVANYVATPSRTCPRMPSAWPKWQFWQWAESGNVPGIYANGDRDSDSGLPEMDAGRPVAASADLNYFDGTQTDLAALIANSVSAGNLPDPPPLANPPHVTIPDASTSTDCNDGCCIAD